MTTAIIIVILILILSVGLFFLIKRLSNVSNIDSEIYADEGAITDFNDVTQEKKELINESDINKSSFNAKFAIIISAIYTFFNKQIQNINKLRFEYKKRQADKIKAKEKAIQEAIRLDQEAQELELKHQNTPQNELDTSYFEINSPNTEAENSINKSQKSLKDINPETKATDFVEQLLSEVDAVSDIATNDDISDTYYYEYMEKRYIDRIVINSKDIEAYKKLGDLYVDMRNYKDALEAFEYVLKLKPSDTIASRRVKDILNRLQKQN